MLKNTKEEGGGYTISMAGNRRCGKGTRTGRNFILHGVVVGSLICQKAIFCCEEACGGGGPSKPFSFCAGGCFATIVWPAPMARVLHNDDYAEWSGTWLFATLCQAFLALVVN